MAEIILGTARSDLCLSCYSDTLLAQTPDGETPAEESVCDVLIGGTPGLYGLCVAYCEAQDADADVGLFSGEACSDRSSHDRLLENYTKKQRTGDPDMPCLRGPCPCFNAADLLVIGTNAERCTSGSRKLTLSGRDAEFCSGSATVTITSFISRECTYRLDTPDTKGCVKGGFISVDITEEEHSACLGLLKLEITGRSIACEITK